MLTVRTATADDAGEIVRINVHAWRRAYTGIVPAEVLDAMEIEGRVDRYRYRMRHSPGFEHLVVADGDKIIGYACLGNYRLGQQQNGALHRQIGEVTAIYVDPPHWGTGAGRALMDAARCRLTERGFSTVRLWVLAANHQARRFYEQACFVPDGATGGYPVGRPDGSVVELPEMRYTRELP